MDDRSGNWNSSENRGKSILSFKRSTTLTIGEKGMAGRWVSPKFPRVRGRRWPAMHGAHHGLMTAASIIWSFWANGQITGERRDYCYYMRPRTQSKPDYTLVSQSLSGVRPFDCQLRSRSSPRKALPSPRSLFKRSINYAHHRNPAD